MYVTAEIKGKGFILYPISRNLHRRSTEVMQVGWREKVARIVDSRHSSAVCVHLMYLLDVVAVRTSTAKTSLKLLKFGDCSRMWPNRRVGWTDLCAYYPKRQEQTREVTALIIRFGIPSFPELETSDTGLIGSTSPCPTKKSPREKAKSSERF